MDNANTEITAVLHMAIWMLEMVKMKTSNNKTTSPHKWTCLSQETKWTEMEWMWIKTWTKCLACNKITMECQHNSMIWTKQCLCNLCFNSKTSHLKIKWTIWEIWSASKTWCQISINNNSKWWWIMFTPNHLIHKLKTQKHPWITWTNFH
jgi:hypothetical protein